MAAAAMFVAEALCRAVRSIKRSTLKITLRNEPLLPAIAANNCVSFKTTLSSVVIRRASGKY